MVTAGKFAVDVVAESRELCILNDTWVLSDVREWLDVLQAASIDLDQKACAPEAAKLIGMTLAGRFENHRMRRALSIQAPNSFHIRAGSHITNACLLVLVPRKQTIRGLPELLDSEAGE